LSNHPQKENKAGEFSFNNKSFLKNDESYFLNSGEMHYFRVDAGLWEKHLNRIKQAGLNTVSTYIPWSLHEQIEGKPDLKGGYADNLNLEKFIELCQSFELNLTVKPGPFILAELAKHGIPKWLTKKYHDTAAIDNNGNVHPADFTCLKHPQYRQKVIHWYDAVMPLLAKYQISNGGPIILMQVCNEVGLFQWLSGCGDYHSETVKSYRDYLEKQYHTINELNKIYESNYETFQQVIPPIGKVNSKSQHFAYQDWTKFHHEFYAEYISWLIQQIRKRDITVPLFHNIPGWVWSKAVNMPVCLAMYEKLSRLYPNILLGVDHIPENISYRNFYDDKIINKMTKAVMGGKAPLYAAELQSGTREANVRIYPNEMHLFYKACLANGITGLNYYMFSQGINPPGWGIYDSYFYLQTPLNAGGEEDELYPVIKNISSIVKTHGKRLCECKSKSDQALMFYPPYYYREFTRPLFGNENRDDFSHINCKINPQMVTDNLLFESLGRLLAMNNQNFDAVDLTHKNFSKISNYKQLWLGSTEQMNAKHQQRLLDYISKGGHLICFPTLPKFEMNGKRCTLLADELSVKTDRIQTKSTGMIKWTDTGEVIHALSYLQSFNSKNGKIIAETDKGKVCGIKISYGKGSAVVFGSGFNYQSPAHKQAWQRLGLNPAEFGQAVICDNPLITTQIRYHKIKGGYIFMLNYHNKTLKGNITFKSKRLPDKGTFHMPPFSGLILPFDLPVSEEYCITDTTSEIVDTKVYSNEIKMKLKGNPKTAGQMQLKSKKSPKQILFNNTPLEYETHPQITKIFYSHSNSEDNLTVKF
jgi:beta-galactosidase